MSKNKENNKEEQNELQTFKFDEMNVEINGLLINDEPYFIGKDIGEALGYSRPSEAIQKHVDEEDKLTRQFNVSGQGRNLVVINESGLYSLILKSKLDGAKKFKRWVTNDVLPSIRKTGGYVSNDDLFINTYLPFADDTTKMLFKGTLETVRKQNELIEQQQKEIEYKEDVIVGLVDKVTLAEKRQILNQVVRMGGGNKTRDRWSALYKQFEAKYHINLNMRLGRYNEENKPKLRNKLDYIDKVMDKIPELYEIACKLFENDVEKLVNELYELNNN